MDFGITKGIWDGMQIFLAINVSFRVTREEIKKTPSYCIGSLITESL